MAQSSLNDVLSGKSKMPAADNMLRIAKALGLRPEYLLWGEGPPEAISFSQLNGLEAQLVMLFRNLPDDAKRDALLIDVNEYFNRHAPKGGSTKAHPFAHVEPPPPTAPKAPPPASTQAPKKSARAKNTEGVK